MIHSSPGRFQAQYKHTSGEKHWWSQKEVVAWDDYGKALVIDDRSGHLREASSYQGFEGVTEADAEIGVLPGGGWMVRYPAGEGYDGWEEPVVGWLITSGGYGSPMTTDSSGAVEPLGSGDIQRGATVYHPDHRWPEA